MTYGKNLIKIRIEFSVQNRMYLFSFKSWHQYFFPICTVLKLFTIYILSTVVKFWISFFWKRFFWLKLFNTHIKPSQKENQLRATGVIRICISALKLFDPTFCLFLLLFHGAFISICILFLSLSFVWLWLLNKSFVNVWLKINFNGRIVWLITSWWFFSCYSRNEN